MTLLVVGDLRLWPPARRRPSVGPSIRRPGLSRKSLPAPDIAPSLVVSFALVFTGVSGTDVAELRGGGGGGGGLVGTWAQVGGHFGGWERKCIGA